MIHGKGWRYPLTSQEPPEKTSQPSDWIWFICVKLESCCVIFGSCFWAAQMRHVLVSKVIQKHDFKLSEKDIYTCYICPSSIFFNWQIPEIPINHRTTYCIAFSPTPPSKIFPALYHQRGSLWHPICPSLTWTWMLWHLGPWRVKVEIFLRTLFFSMVYSICTGMWTRGT